MKESHWNRSDIPMFIYRAVRDRNVGSDKTEFGEKAGNGNCGSKVVNSFGRDACQRRAILTKTLTCLKALWHIHDGRIGSKTTSGIPCHIHFHHLFFPKVVGTAILKRVFVSAHVYTKTGKHVKICYDFKVKSIIHVCLWMRKEIRETFKLNSWVQKTPMQKRPNVRMCRNHKGSECGEKKETTYQSSPSLVSAKTKPQRGYWDMSLTFWRWSLCLSLFHLVNLPSKVLYPPLFAHKSRLLRLLSGSSHMVHRPEESSFALAIPSSYKVLMPPWSFMLS